MSEEVERLGQRIADLEDSLEQLMRTGIGLGNSSFDDGRINQYSGGLIGGSFGTQYDGTNGAVPLASPVPPTPRWTDDFGPMVEPVTGGLRVRWEGFWDGGQTVVAPLGLKEVEVHASDQQTLTGITFDTLKTTITSARGGEVYIPLPYLESGYYLRLTARSTAGRASVPSSVIGPFVPLKVLEEDLGFDLNDFGGSSIFYGTTTPTATGFGDLWLKEIAPGPPPKYETWRWAPQTGDPTQGQWVQLADGGAAAALAAAIAAQQSVDTKARVFTQPDEPVWTGASGSAVWIDTDAGNVTKVWDGAAFITRRLGNGAIQPQSLIASDVFVTGSVTAALLETILILASTIILGSPTGTHIKMDPEDGIVAYVEDLTDGVPNEVARFGQTSGGHDPITGLMTWNIDAHGRAIFAGGADFGVEPSVQGIPLSQRFDNIARGQVVRGQKATQDWDTNLSQGAGIYEVQFTAYADRAYEIYLGGFYVYGYNATTPEFGVKVLAGMNGTAPNYTGATVHVQTFPRTVNTWNWVTGSSPYYPTFAAGQTEQTIRLLLVVFATSGNVRAPAGYQSHLVVRDVGPRIPETGTMNFLLPSSAPAGPAVQRYQQDFLSTWTRSYDGNGNLLAGVGESALYQGYDTTNGQTRSHIGFPQVAAALAGATVETAYLFLHADWWYNFDGGVGIIGLHTFVNPPSTWGGIGNEQAQYPGWGRGQGRWIGLGTEGSYWATNLQNGVAKGISLGPASSTDPLFYGRFQGRSEINQPILRVTYRK